jgi:hypothetical protein
LGTSRGWVSPFLETMKKMIEQKRKGGEIEKEKKENQ